MQIPGRNVIDYNLIACSLRLGKGRFWAAFWPLSNDLLLLFALFIGVCRTLPKFGSAFGPLLELSSPCSLVQTRGLLLVD